MQSVARKVELRDVVPGLGYGEWTIPSGRGTMAGVRRDIDGCRVKGERLVLDPLAPPESETDVWERLDASPPPAIVVLKPDHVREVDLFVRRYRVRAYGPRLFFRDNIPETRLEPIQPGSKLPGGILGSLRRTGPRRDTALAAGATYHLSSLTH